MTQSDDELHELTERAMNAFWQVIADRFPQATTGDLSIDRTVRLHVAVEEAVREWINNNAVPDDPDEQPGVPHVHIRPGYRFMLRRDVDRFPDFLVRKGATGTVVRARNGAVIALMDQIIQGAEEWDNHVFWERDFLDDTLPLDS
jgi:hypothetical protein